MIISGTPFEKRHIQLDGARTTLALEPPYWRMLEILAARSGTSWPEVVRALLDGKPPSFRSRAGFLRLAVVKLAIRHLDPQLHGEMFRVG